MKIAILTLPLHSNYGGILQAYALQTVLIRMGHNVEVLVTDKVRNPFALSMLKTYMKRLVKNLILPKKTYIFEEYRQRKELSIVHKNTTLFIDKYINTRFIHKLSQINANDYDSIIVGSDQVWRKNYFTWMWQARIQDAFLQFTDKWPILRRVAYAASFGLDDLQAYTKTEKKECAKAIEKFTSVSVREEAGLVICREILGIEASLVLDPTMLLNRSDYMRLIVSSNVPKNPGNMLCYILDPTGYKSSVITAIAYAKKLQPFNVNAETENFSLPVISRIQPPVEGWLRGFYDASFIITDSYHACVFAILFRKPFIAIGNANRGLSRFKSLLNQFNLLERLITTENIQNAISIAETDIDWRNVDFLIDKLQKKSYKYLTQALC